MVAIKVMSNDVAISMANSQGNFELNVFKPLIASCIIQSIKLLRDVCYNFTQFLILGMKVNKKKVANYVENSLMLVTALSPYIGYEKCAQLAKYAQKKNLTLREANKKLNFLSESNFNKYLDIRKMI
jgi:fumarate hydratase class II